MHMKELFLICFLINMALLSGCEAAFERRLKSSSCDRYAITAEATMFTNAEYNFDDKARELCPQGYTVLKRYYEFGEVKGRVECECQAGNGKDKKQVEKRNGNDKEDD
jgi:hypothetical protein